VPNILSVEEPELLPDDELETAIGRITDAASLGQRILIEAELARSIKSYVPSSTPAKIASPEAAKLS
jgi:hypothetical protein